MASRKQVVKNRNELANVMARLEGGKSQARVGDHRQMLKILVMVEAEGYKSRHKSVFMMLRKEAVQIAKKAKGKKK